jgi:TetR/AcrR family transcriptional regulator
LGKQRDLNRSREKLMAAALKEFATKGFTGARTGVIARRSGVNERMIFYCFGSKEGLYRAVLAANLADRAKLMESTPEDDFTSALVKGFATSCADGDAVRIWQWEALHGGRRKLMAEEERRVFFQAQVARLRRAKLHGALPPEADEQTLLLVSMALRVFPLLLPQAIQLVTGMDPLDPEFRRQWIACLEWVGGRLQAPATSSPTDHRIEGQNPRELGKPQMKTRRQTADTGRGRKSDLRPDA